MSQLSLPEEPRLKELVLWVTTDCNLRCRYCYASGGDEAEYMDWQVAKQALDIMLSQSDSFKIQFAGGEPLLNMDLIEQVVGYTQGLGIRYQLQTNASLIDDKVAANLERMGVDVGVSLDGLPEVNDSLRPFADGHGSTAATISRAGEASGGWYSCGVDLCPIRRECCWVTRTGRACQLLGKCGGHCF